MIVILGPTASGKTSLAVKLAYEFNGEIISADSRQIYKGMDIGTGKDLGEYIINKHQIKYHLIDIISPNTDYSVFQFKKDYTFAYQSIINKNKNPFLCGGTGLYIESVLLDYQIMETPPNRELRQQLDQYNRNQLIEYLESIKKNAFNPDYHISNRRLIRSIEILSSDKLLTLDMDMQKNISSNNLVIGIKINRDKNLNLIKKRLHERLDSGMIQEVETLINKGLDLARLQYFGLEYKFIGKYLSGEIKYDDMVTKLNFAINKFSKRQMTFFRRMEKRNININWIDINQYQNIQDLVINHLNA